MSHEINIFLFTYNINKNSLHENYIYPSLVIINTQYIYTWFLKQVYTINSIKAMISGLFTSLHKYKHSSFTCNIGLSSFYLCH